MTTKTPKFIGTLNLYWRKWIGKFILNYKYSYNDINEIRIVMQSGKIYIIEK